MALTKGMFFYLICLSPHRAVKEKLTIANMVNEKI